MKRIEVLDALSKGVCESSVYCLLNDCEWLDEYEFVLSTYDVSANLDVISKASFVPAVRSSQLIANDCCIGVSVFKSKLNFRFVFDFHD